MSSGGTKRKAVKLMRHDYNVAWICPVSNVELSPARLLLDTKHQTPDYDSNYDDNVYKFGSMGKHNVVLASLPLAMTGNVNAARLTSSVFRTFPNIKIALLVGIGGGVPLSQPQSNPLKDIHLGDVVVGWSTDKSRLSTINYEAGRTHVGGEFEILDHSNRPQWGSLSAISALQNDHELHETEFDVYLDKLRSSDENRKKFSHPGLEHDRLFKADFKHIGDYGNCTRCQQSTTGLVPRPARTSEHAREFVFHFGRIATGGSVIQDGQRRDEISRLCGGILCIEMEVAGVDANSPCLVIRGISDYADSHKNDVWKSYAAGNAAVFARHLLELIPRTVNSKDERRDPIILDVLSRLFRDHPRITKKDVDCDHGSWRDTAFNDLIRYSQVSEWMAEGTQQAIWFQDISGAGHSLLSSKIIDIISSTSIHDSDMAFLAYVFCRRTENEENRTTVVEILSALLYTLLMNPNFPASAFHRIEQDYGAQIGDSDSDDSRLDSLVKLLEITLDTCVSEDDHRKVFLVVDGLSFDPSPVSSSPDKDVLRKFIQLVRFTSAKSDRLRWLISSPTNDPGARIPELKKSTFDFIKISPLQVVSALGLDGVVHEIETTALELRQIQGVLFAKNDTDESLDKSLDWFRHCNAGKSWLRSSSESHRRSRMIWYRRNSASAMTPSRLGLAVSQSQLEGMRSVGCYFSFSSVFTGGTKSSTATGYKFLHPCQALWSMFAQLATQNWGSQELDLKSNIASILLSFSLEVQSGLRDLCSNLKPDALQTTALIPFMAHSEDWHWRIRLLNQSHLDIIATSILSLLDNYPDKDSGVVFVIDCVEIAPAKDCSAFMEILERMTSHVKIMLCLDTNHHDHTVASSEWCRHMPSISVDENTEYQECLQSLQFPNMHRRRDQIETALRNTNKWLWNHDDYRKWEQKGGLLWISGKPGSGKSVLAKSIQHRFRHKSNTDWSFCSWFYTSRDLEIGVRHSFMLRAIMYQILFMNKDAFLAIRPHYRDQQSHSRGQIELWSQEVLQKALVGLSRATCMRPTIIVIDGFDESDSEPSRRAAVLDMFHELYHRPGRTRIILLSRHLPEIEKQSQGFFKILMEGCNERDINDVIRHGINELSSAWSRRLTSTQPPKTSAMGEPQTEVSDPTLRKIESYLRNNSSGVILWVRLVFREIETDFKRRTGFTEEELWRAIESLPLELESLYAHSLRRLSKSMSPEEEATAKEIFAWIVVSPNIEALQLPQLREAMALSKFIPGEDYSTKLLQDRKTLLMQTPNGELDWNHFRNIVYEHCGPLVEFVPLISQSPYEEDSRLVQSSSDISSMTAQLIHQTVDVFLRDPSRSGSWFIDQQEVERKIANISHGYLGIGKSSRPTPKRLMADQFINSHIHGHFGALKKNFSNVMSTPLELLAMDEYQRLRPLASFALATISRLNSYQHSVVEALELIDNKSKIEDRLVTYCMPDLLFTPPALGTSLKRIVRHCCSHGQADNLKKVFELVDKYELKYKSSPTDKRTFVKGRDLEMISGAMETLDGLRPQFQICFRDIAVDLRALSAKHSTHMDTSSKTAKNIQQIAAISEPHTCDKRCALWIYRVEYPDGEAVEHTTSEKVQESLRRIVEWLKVHPVFQPFSHGQGGPRNLFAQRPDQATQFSPIAMSANVNPTSTRTHFLNP